MQRASAPCANSVALSRHPYRLHDTIPRQGEKIGMTSYWRNRMTETIETLSSPDQTLDVEYFHRVLNFTDKAVIAAPCGWGKTVGICAYMAETYRKGVLYVAERKEQLEHVQERLINVHGVPEDDIGCYHGGNPEQLAQLAAGVTKPIALLTYSRIQSHHPGKYVLYQANT